MNDLMIDLETLDTTPHAVVISIGACFFDIESEKIGATFHMILKIKDQMDTGRKLDADTLKWWVGQEDAAKKIFHEKSAPTLSVLGKFQQWVTTNKTAKRVKVWGNGSHFDISIMEDIFRQYNIGCPWGYSDVMDLRTFKRFVGKGSAIPMIGVKHNALDDAITQAQYVIDQSKIYKQVEALAEQMVRAGQK